MLMICVQSIHKEWFGFYIFKRTRHSKISPPRTNRSPRCSTRTNSHLRDTGGHHRWWLDPFLDPWNWGRYTSMEVREQKCMYSMISGVHPSPLFVGSDHPISATLAVVPYAVASVVRLVEGPSADGPRLRVEVRVPLVQVLMVSDVTISIHIAHVYFVAATCKISGLIFERQCKQPP